LKQMNETNPHHANTTLDYQRIDAYRQRYGV
jgi:hypothetical protein